MPFGVGLAGQPGALVAVDGSIASMALQLVGELPGAVGAAIAQVVDPGPDVVALLQRDPQAELQALLEVLEPVISDVCSEHRVK